ncbi:rhamnulose-1-phosphate aldolase [Saliterribacillus persicus]|nr:rhamnulose-1-phosphate aldolase [Saliterribacillus persicus]
MINKKDEILLNVPEIQELMKLTQDMWKMGWDERNGGNISYLLKEENIIPYLSEAYPKRQMVLDFKVELLKNQYLLVTASGEYFRNIIMDPLATLGIIRISEDGNFAEIVWGFEGEGKPTSELSSHLMSHEARLAEDPEHRVIMHTHATNLIAMTFTHVLSEKEMSSTLWKMCTECIVVFPEGVGILPWMIPGTDEIGIETASKMKDFRLVVWPHHGIFGSGATLNEAFGLIETAEKAAEIYMLVKSHPAGIMQEITDQQLIDLAKAFNVKPNPLFLS